MKMKCLSPFFILILLLIFKFESSAEKPVKKSFTLGTNYGYFDMYMGRGPVMFGELDYKLSPGIQIGPHLLLAYGNGSHAYSLNGEPGYQYSSTTTIEPGVIAKFNFPVRILDRFKLVQGLTYLYEESLLCNTLREDGNWNGKRTNEGVNYQIGLDIDLIRKEEFSTGINFRINTSGDRVLLYHFGIVTHFEIGKN